MDISVQIYNVDHDFHLITIQILIIVIVKIFIYTYKYSCVSREMNSKNAGIHSCPENGNK